MRPLNDSLDKRTVLISGARAPVALSIGRSFAAAGFDVHFVDSVPTLMIRWSSFGAKRLHRTRSPRLDFAGFLEDVGRLIATLKPTLLIPTCEEIFYLARAAELAGFSERLFAPALDLLRTLHSKALFAQLAAECGLHPPRTWRVISPEELQAFRANSRDLVFKPEYSRFAAETLVRPDKADLRKINPATDKPWVVQEFVEGREVGVWSAARGGKLVAAAAYLPMWRFGGAGAYFLRDDDPALVGMCATLAERTGLTGQLSLDVIRTAAGELRPIECNPRSVSGVHLLAEDGRLGQVLAGEQPGLLTPAVRARHVGGAFWTAALGRVLRSGDVADVIRDARLSRDVLSGRGNRLTAIGGSLDFCRFAFTGAVASRSAVRESTADIEWNGEPFR